MGPAAPSVGSPAPALVAMPGSVAVARQPLELKSLVRIQAGQSPCTESRTDALFSPR